MEKFYRGWKRFPGRFPQDTVEKFRFFLDFFLRKTWQRFHRSGHFTGILEKSSWNKKCVFQRLLSDAAKKNFSSFDIFFEKVEKTIKLEKNTSCRHFSGNFISIKNVPPDKFYGMLQKNRRHVAHRLAAKCKKLKMTWKREKIHFPSIFVKISLMSKTFPSTSYIRLHWKNIVIIWTFSSENEKNRLITQKNKVQRGVRVQGWQKLESRID